MAAVPIGFMPEEVLANGNMDPPPGVVGPSTVLRLPGMVIENGVLTPHWISHVGRCSRSERECDWEPSTRRCQRGLSLHPRHQAAFCNPSSSLAYNLGSGVGRGQWGHRAYFSADGGIADGAEMEAGDSAEDPPVTPRPAGRMQKSKGSCAWARAAYTWRKAAYGRHFGVLYGAAVDDEPRFQQELGVPRTKADRVGEESGGPCSSDSPKCSTSPAYLLSTDATDVKPWNHSTAAWNTPKNSCTFSTGSVRISFGAPHGFAGVGGREERGRPIFLLRSSCPSSTSSIASLDGAGGTDRPAEQRSSFGAQHYGSFGWDQRCTGPSSFTSRASSTEGNLFQLSASRHVTEDVPYHVTRGQPTGAHGQGHLWNPLLGKIWWLWQGAGTGLSSTSSDVHHGLPADSKLAGGEGSNSFVGGHFGSSSPGLWEGRPGSTSLSSRRTSIHGVHQPTGEHPGQDKSLLAPGRSEMDHSCIGLHKGAGRHHLEAPGIDQPKQARSIRQQLPSRNKLRPAQSKAGPKEETEGRRKRKSIPLCRSRRSLEPGDSGKPEAEISGNPLQSKISFLQWAICLPRWILRSKTKFSYCLARSFAVLSRSDKTASTVFPLPLPSLDCFACSGPGLSHRRLWTLAKTRLLNIWILVLDFMYLGRWPSLEELRRSPSAE